MNKSERNISAFFGGIVLVVVVSILFVLTAKADDHSGMMPMPASQTQRQGQGQRQKQTASASANQTQGNAQSTTFEGSAPDVILIPNNNTESCLRVFGLAFSNQSGGGGIGYPWRSAACDFQRIADDSAARGDHRLADYWRCHKKNIYKTFKRKGVSKDEAIEACYYKMWAMSEPPRPEKSEYNEPIVINCDHPETHERLFEACQEK